MSNQFISGTYTTCPQCRGLGNIKAFDGVRFAVTCPVCCGNGSVRVAARVSVESEGKKQ